MTAVVGAVEGGYLLAVDQAFRFRDGDLGFGLRVGHDDLDLGAAHGLDASGRVDVIGGHFGGVDAKLSESGARAAPGVNDADPGYRRQPGRSSPN